MLLVQYVSAEYLYVFKSFPKDDVLSLHTFQGVPLFHHYSGVFRVTLFRCSWFYSMPSSNGLTKLRFKYNNIGPGCNTNMPSFSESHTSGAWNTNCQMNSQHSSIIWPVLLNSWVFVYELSVCGFDSSCSHLNSRFNGCFEQGVPWHWDNYRVWIHSERRTWHDKNIQSNAPYR